MWTQCKMDAFDFLHNPIFSCKDNSRITNVRLSITKTPQPHRIAPIDHRAYRPSSLSTIKPINHQAYQPSSLSTIKHIDHQAYRPSSIATIKPIDHQAYQPWSLSPIKPINHWAYQPSTIEPIYVWSSFVTFKPFGLFTIRFQTFKSIPIELIGK